MYVTPEETKCEVHEFLKIAPKAVREHNDYTARYSFRPNVRPVSETRPKPAKSAPPDDLELAPPL